MKMIEMIGCRLYDLTIYLAQLLTAMGETVYVSDRSQRHRMSLYLPKIADAEGAEVLEFRGVLYGNSHNAPPDECTYYFEIWDAQDWGTDTDVILHQDAEEKPQRMFISDEEPEHISEVDGAIRRTHKKDSEDERCNTVILRENLGMIPVLGEMYSMAGSAVYKLPYCEKDRKAELYLSVREDAGMRPVSEKMSSVLEELVHRIRRKTTNAEFERAYRVALKGGGR